MREAELPIVRVLPALREALRAHTSAVLEAPPGAGKTTGVPPALLDEPWLAGQRIIMLEPRRLAARAAARRMAALAGERVGETVGYRMRMDTRVGARTRIEVVTEGVLTRLLQSDPALEGVGLVIFDEFHERSLQADLGLALCLEARSVLRDDLRVLVMSATLDTEPVAALLGRVDGGGERAPIVRSEGRSHPVEVRYAPRRMEGRLEPVVASAVRGALARDSGDVLVFLPGGGEIRRVQALLAEADLGPDIHVVPLYGDLPQELQDHAITPSAPGARKVVLATPIAETSLTIEGVRVVIDSGLVRVPRFSPRSGMTALETVRVSRASAEQRRGRAGRVAPGVCYRLWPEHEQGHLVPHATPEILEADLAPIALELAEAGIADPALLAWLDQPPAAAFAQARELLGELGALDREGRITSHGRRMAELAMHPRLAHMVLTAIPKGHGALACEIAALLGERDLLRAEGGGSRPEADLRLRLEVLREGDRGDRGAEAGHAHGYRVEREARRRVRAQADAWMRQLGVDREMGRSSRQGTRDDAAASRGIEEKRGQDRPTDAGEETKRAPGAGDDIEACGLVLAFAYPDRIAQRRPTAGTRAGAGAGAGTPGRAGGRFLLRNGRGAALGEPQALWDAPYIVVAALDGQQPSSRISLAAPLDVEELTTHFADQIEGEDVIAWDEGAQAVVARRRERLGALVLRDVPLPDPDWGAVTRVLLDAIVRSSGGVGSAGGAGVAGGLDALPWSEGARELRERIAFLRAHDPAWPDVSDAALTATLDQWLAPHLHGVMRLDELRDLDLAGIVRELLTWEQRALLDELAPTHLTVPSGSRVRIDYSDPTAPVLAVRLQEMFGLADTPRIARGRVPLTLHLLSPARRPVQVTRDLAGFWRSTYFDVRKELKGRYPKHHWPDDPLGAQPTSRAKRRD
jgi:ATP-dependent helicase HrpB